MERSGWCEHDAYLATENIGRRGTAAEHQYAFFEEAADEPYVMMPLRIAWLTASDLECTCSLS